VPRRPDRSAVPRAGGRRSRRGPARRAGGRRSSGAARAPARGRRPGPAPAGGRARRGAAAPAGPPGPCGHGRSSGIPDGIVRPGTARAYAAILDAGITPVVHEYGSLGCSGDLAPLAHVALALLGEGEVDDAHGARRPAAEALADAGCAPVELAEKEGLALINGTDGMLGMLLLALHDLRSLLRAADVAAALSVEALLGTDAVFA